MKKIMKKIIDTIWRFVLDWNRTEQNRTEQNRTEQNRTEQNRTEQNKSILRKKGGSYLIATSLMKGGKA